MNNDATGAIIVILLLAVHVTCLVICGMKGKVGVIVLAILLLGLLASVPGACRLAKPDSYWARRFYDQDQRRRAAERFGPGRAPVNTTYPATPGY